MKSCYYCWFAGRVAPLIMVALALVLWALNIDRELNFTAGWLVLIALVLAVGHWILGKRS